MAEPGTLGRYRIERVLGKGAMGVVYEAHDPKLNRKVAIKTILISQLDEETSKDFSMRFEREAHAVARLNHPNIVQVYDFGEEGGVAYLVMEFIRGRELKSSLTGNQPLDRAQCVRIMCELLDALDFAHDAGVIHRDIKPANVMLDSQGRAKLTDFGVARLTDADRTSAERTQAGTMVGTPAYMSPEQVQGHRVDRRSDIFSAGIILYQFLTGQKPFTGEGAWTVAKKIILDDPPMPSALNVAVSPEFDRVVAKALAKNPEQRFSTAGDFARALKRAAEGKPAIDEDETTVVLPPRETPAPAQTQTQTSRALPSSEMELEFWRSIKDSDDPNDYELYVRQFPQGVYASLAGRKIAKLRDLPAPGGSEETGTRQLEATDRTRLAMDRSRAEAPKPASPAIEKTVKLAGAAAPAPAAKKRSLLVPVVLGLLAVAGASAYFVMNRSPRPAVATAPPAPAPAAKVEPVQAAPVEEPKPAVAAPTPPAEAVPPAASAAPVEVDAEKAERRAELRARFAAQQALWESIKTGADPADYRKYLDEYPRGPHAEQARKRLFALTTGRAQEQKRLAEEKQAAENARLEEEARIQRVEVLKREQQKKRQEQAKKNLNPPTF